MTGLKILAVESSAVSASAAVCDNGRIISENYINAGLTHSQTLMPMIKNCMDTAGVTLSDIDLVAVAHGPGSFTGLRIGIATVKGDSPYFENWYSEDESIATIKDGVITAVGEGNVNIMAKGKYMRAIVGITVKAPPKPEPTPEPTPEPIPTPQPQPQPTPEPTPPSSDVTVGPQPTPQPAAGLRPGSAYPKPN